MHVLVKKLKLKRYLIFRCNIIRAVGKEGL